MNSAANTDLISVIVPIFNVESYLPACLDSILAQAYPSLEIILIDDGSTDHSGRICDDYKAKNKNIVVIHKSNGGLSDARNAGIDIAKGKFITFVDSDDLVHPLCFQSLFNALSENQAEISVCPLRSFSSKQEARFLNKRVDHEVCSKNTTVFSSESALKEMLYEGRFDISACGKLYLASLFKDVRFPKDKLFEDLATTYQLIWKARSVALIPYRLYGYRQRTGSITRVPFHNKMLDGITACEAFCSFAQVNCHDCGSAIAYRRSKTATILLERLMNSSDRSLYSDTVREMQKILRENLTDVLKYEKVFILQKVKIVSGAYSIYLLKLVCKLYAILFFFYERLS